LARRQVKRGALPKSLPRIETIIDVENQSLVVRRPKYAYRVCPS
jgi:hypothetical protein